MLLRFLLTVEECFREICLRGRPGFRPHDLGLDVHLEFIQIVLDGVVTNGLGFCGILAFSIVSKARLLLLFACLSGGLHGDLGGIPFFVLDAVCSVSVYLWAACEKKYPNIQVTPAFAALY